MLLDQFAKGNWHHINDLYSAGKINVGEFNDQTFSLVKTSKRSMRDYLKGKITIRPGFTDFIKLCGKKGIRVVIVSNGLDFYIKQVLDDLGFPETEFHAAETRFHSNILKVRYPDPAGKTVNEGFKDIWVQKFVSEGYHVVYVGNGTSDLSPARGAHRIFATESLLEHCQINGVTCIPFTSFKEINKEIETW
jgi:2-hydroxy-3-keto-5-methylthiopentenyl-1-phosphate phosphatase